MKSFESRKPDNQFFDGLGKSWNINGKRTLEKIGVTTQDARSKDIIATRGIIIASKERHTLPIDETEVILPVDGVLMCSETGSPKPPTAMRNDTIISTGQDNILQPGEHTLWTPEGSDKAFHYIMLKGLSDSEALDALAAHTAHSMWAIRPDADEFKRDL